MNRDDDFDEADDEDLALGIREGIRVGGVVILLALVFAIVVALAGCGTVKPPPVPIDPGDATCATACARVQELGCGSGPRCVPACENVQASGVFAYDVGCLTRAPSCAVIDACFSLNAIPSSNRQKTARADPIR